VGFELKNGYDGSDWPEKQYPHTRAGTRAVATKEPNAWGLYDMLGNVWEWCADHWHDSYAGAPANGAAWLDADNDSGAADRVFRGGSWNVEARYVRAACRLPAHPAFRLDYLGFRCARVQA
jgi:formylglycine-generating enzyme required for sulfatase activity